MKMEDYGDNFQAHILEQYKIYIEMMDRVSARRLQANKFYISLLSGLLAVFSFILTNKTIFSGFQKLLSILVGTLAILLCLVWYVNIQSYKQLNFLKFQVIDELEQHLPFPLYKREWEILKQENQNKIYRRLTAVEKYVPLILAVPYCILLIYFLVK